MRAVAMILPLAGCLTITSQEDADRQRVASLVGPYAGDWSLTLSLTARKEATCSGDAGGTVDGTVWGDPLTLASTFSCTTDGLIALGANAEIALDASFDGAIDLSDTAAAPALSGEMQLSYQDFVGNPEWSGNIDEGDFPVINGQFSGIAQVAVIGAVTFSGDFTLTHAAAD